MRKYKNCDISLLQTGCLGVPEFLHQLQLQTQVGNGERKRKRGENSGERKNGEKNAVRKRKMGEHNGKEKWDGKIEKVEEAGGICVREYQKEGREEEVGGGVVRCCKLE